jgi:hypothetical protein
VAFVAEENRAIDHGNGTAWVPDPEPDDEGYNQISWTAGVINRLDLPGILRTVPPEDAG